MTTVQGVSQPQAFNKTTYYKAISSEDQSAVNHQLTILTGAPLNEKEAYEGALLMKKAEFEGKPKEKLDLFKSGRIKLESCIKRDSLNVELYFLRLIIQEHAPKIMKYSKDMKKDSEFIQRSYKKLSGQIKEEVLRYSTMSKVLKIKEN